MERNREVWWRFPSFGVFQVVHEALLHSQRASGGQLPIFVVWLSLRTVSARAAEEGKMSLDSGASPILYIES